MRLDRMERALSFGSRTKQFLRGFFRKEDGSTTMECVLWFPFHLALLGMIGDASIGFMNYNRMWDAARDTARRAAIGELSASEAEQFAADNLPGFMVPSVTIDTSSATDITVQISASLSNLTFFQAIESFATGDVTARVVMRKEI